MSTSDSRYPRPFNCDCRPSVKKGRSSMSNVPRNRADFRHPFKEMIAGELTQAKYVFSARPTARRAKITQHRVYRSPHSDRQTSQILLSLPAC
jgi:hypothetical protein